MTVRDPYAATTSEENQSVTTGDRTRVTQQNYPENPEQSNAPTDLSIQETRQQLVSLYVRGQLNDAKALFSAVQGATEAAWTNFERILTPVKDFVIMGNLPYLNPTEWTGEYAGIADQRSEDRDAVQAGDEVTLQTTTGHRVQAVQQETGEGVETTPLPGAQPTQTSAKQEEEPATASGRVPAAELVERARNAKTKKELDEIEDLSEGRVRVLDAIDQRRDELKR